MFKYMRMIVNCITAMRIRFTILIPALLGLVVCLVAAAHASRADGLNIVITIKDHEFEPSEVTAPAGHKIKIIVRNQGTTTSEFEARISTERRWCGRTGKSPSLSGRSTLATMNSSTISIRPRAVISS